MAAVNDIAPRRAFLRQLATLPLIGGAVALIGQPSAVAEPVTADLLQTYSDWLSHEFDRICFEMHGPDRWQDVRRSRHFIGPGHEFHRASGGGFNDAFGNHSPPPSSRAALVLSTVGCDWRGWKRWEDS